jgi:translation elongation factor EF-G
VIEATVPLANMFDYVTDLEALAEGRAAVSMFFERYDFIPPEDTDPDDTFAAAAALRA